MQIKLVLPLLVASLPLFAGQTSRFFVEGDGRITLAKNGERREIQYRREDGSYPPEARHEMNRLFGAPQNPEDGIALRLIALLDHLEDRFGVQEIKIVSGYRTPAQNERLRRRKRRRTAKTSLHMDGMAADVELEGAAPEGVRNYLKSLNCCGVGYYHGNGLHVDIGPPRFWDEKTVKADQDLGAENKLLIARTDRDIYYSGEEVEIRLARVTNYPVGISSDLELLSAEKKVGQFSLNESEPSCRKISGRRGKRLFWKIPEGYYTRGKARVRLKLCDKKYALMPDEIETNPIQILREAPHVVRVSTQKDN